MSNILSGAGPIVKFVGKVLYEGGRLGYGTGRALGKGISGIAKETVKGAIKGAGAVGESIIK